MTTVEILSNGHRKIKKEFVCGNVQLDHYLRNQASQDVRRMLAACYVSVDSKIGLIQGYYTLSNNSIPLSMVPELFRAHLPGSYSSIPVTLLGRLAVDQKFQGTGIGKLLLIDALSRCLSLSGVIGSFAVAVDPIDAEAEGFYTKYGFIMLPDSRKMFLPMATIAELFADK